MHLLYQKSQLSEAERIVLYSGQWENEFSSLINTYLRREEGSGKWGI